MTNLLRKPLTWVLAAVLAVGLVAGLYLFQPWKLFVDQTVDEALPSAAAPAATGSPDPSATPA
ncbi:MAG: DM13 domain-containing protein, partial [Micromonosporaceae bacterium]